MKVKNGMRMRLYRGEVANYINVYSVMCGSLFDLHVANISSCSLLCMAMVLGLLTNAVVNWGLMLVGREEMNKILK